MDTITVATFNEKEKAEPLKQRLQQAGIQAFIDVESKMERLWYVAKPLAGVHLKVHAPDHEKACRLMKEWDQEDDALHDAIRCPECTSSNVEYPQFAQKSVMPNFFGGVAAALGLIEKEFYCRDCHYTWPREGRKLSRSRPHMAPFYFIEGVPAEEPAEKNNPEHN